MLRRIAFVFVISTLILCSKNNKLNIVLSDDEFCFELKYPMSIFLGSNIGIFEQNGNEHLYYFSKADTCIYYYKLFDTNTLCVPLNKLLGHRIKYYYGDIIGCYVNNLDSIWFDSGQYLDSIYLYNSVEGSIKAYKIQYKYDSGFDTLIVKPYIFSYLNPFIKINEKKYISCYTYDTNFEKVPKDFYSVSECTLSNNIFYVKNKFARLPSLYYEKNFYDFAITKIVKNDSIIINHTFSDSIYILSNGKTHSICMKSKYSDEFLSSNRSTKNMTDIVNFYDHHPMYYKIMYDYKHKLYYRIFRHNNFKNQKNPYKTPHRLDNKWSLLVYDNNFKYINEFIYDYKIYDYTMVFVTKTGQLLFREWDNVNKDKVICKFKIANIEYD
jgi:hypothetical protein